MFLGKPDKSLPASTDTNTRNRYREDLVAWGLNYYKLYSDRVERFHQERLSTEIVFDSIISMIEDTIFTMIGAILGNESSLDAGQLRRLESECRLVFRQSPRLRDESDADMDPNAVMEKLCEWAISIYRKRIDEIGHSVVARYERYYILDKIDENWRAHLNGVDELREGIGLRGYGQKDPLLEYKSEAYKMFMKMIDSINREVVSTLFRVFDVGGELENRDLRRAEPMQLATSHSQVELFKQLMTTRKPQPTLAQAPRDGGVRKPVVNAPKVGRNDPCPCGSGKKYKNCCGKGV
ncbi:MAG TPA: SEC-C metal-binding domain-containing protein [bacterium]|nr:SEC-C metal-binding domain-containing protein [bacterium]HPN45531.1 SEC-C metal-binding domain-containing protein [bacterium]